MVPVLSQTNPVHSLTHPDIKIHFILFYCLRLGLLGCILLSCLPKFIIICMVQYCRKTQKIM
jgi:hypothetical protein